MKKRLKKLIFPVCLLFVLLLVAALPTFAAEDGSGRFYMLDDIDYGWVEFDDLPEDYASFGYCPGCNCIFFEYACSMPVDTNCPFCSVAITYSRDDGVTLIGGSPSVPDEPTEPDQSSLAAGKILPFGDIFSKNPSSDLYADGAFVYFGDVTFSGYDFNEGVYHSFTVSEVYFASYGLAPYSIQALHSDWNYDTSVASVYHNKITLNSSDVGLGDLGVLYFSYLEMKYDPESVVIYSREVFDLFLPEFFGSISVDIESIRQEAYDDGYDWGFTQGVLSVDPEAIRQEGFSSGYAGGFVDGFNDGVASIDQVAIRQEGFIAGVASIDQVAIRQEGFNAGVASIDQVAIRQEGFNAGVASIDQAAIRQEAYDAGFTDGLAVNDLDAIRQEGFNAGVASVDRVAIRQEGFNAGVASVDRVAIRQEGFNAGVASIDQPALRKEGYDLGYSAGKKYAQTVLSAGTFNSLITSVVDAPIKAVTGLLDFEILGQNMLSFLGALMALCLIVFILKRVI